MGGAHLIEVSVARCHRHMKGCIGREEGLGSTQGAPRRYSWLNLLSLSPGIEDKERYQSSRGLVASGKNIFQSRDTDASKEPEGPHIAHPVTIDNRINGLGRSKTC